MTEEILGQLVDRFYAKVRGDQLIGPLFNSAVSDWPEHLEKLTAFWSSVMTTSGRYKGNPMSAHLRHAARIKPEMFERWLELWHETARELLDEANASAIVAKAERIAQSLQLGLYFRLPSQRRATAA